MRLALGEGVVLVPCKSNMCKGGVCNPRLGHVCISVYVCLGGCGETERDTEREIKDRGEE